MTRADWLTTTRLDWMLRFLIGSDEPRVEDATAFPDCRASDRKLRLFACACYHRLRRHLPNSTACAAVAVAERLADGEATEQERLDSEDQVYRAAATVEGPWRVPQEADRAILIPEHTALALATQVVRARAQEAAWYAASNAHHDVGYLHHPYAPPHARELHTASTAEQAAQVDLLRCIFGTLPFDDRRETPPPWWTVTVGNLAHTIYRQRDFAALPILADASEDAGCTEVDLLAHLRAPVAHARGCWALDLALLRE